MLDRFVDRPDARLRYETGGSGAPVLLVQGVGAPGGAWRPQVDGLADAHTLAWFDHRGIGRSSPLDRDTSVAELAADSVALMDHLGWDRAHVVGHSLGGVIAQELALTWPARVTSLSLLCTFHRGRDATALSARMAWIGARTRIGTRRMRRRAFLELIWPRSLRATADLDALADELGALFERDLADSPAIVGRQLRALAAHDASARLPALAPIPTLVVAADEDPIAPPAQGRRLAGAIPGAAYHELADASHACVIHAADRVNALLRSHWAPR